jgi:hypothetical protein
VQRGKVPTGRMGALFPSAPENIPA